MFCKGCVCGIKVKVLDPKFSTICMVRVMSVFALDYYVITNVRAEVHGTGTSSYLQRELARI